MKKHSSRQFKKTNFQDLVAKVKNLVALAPVLGEISRPEVSLCSWFFFCRFVLLLFASITSQSYWSVSLRHKRRQILQNDRSIVSLNYSRLSSYNSSLSSSILTKDPVEKVWSSPSTIWRSKVLSRSSLSSEESSWSKHLNISLRHFRIWIHASFFSSAIYKFSSKFTGVRLHARL